MKNNISPKQLGYALGVILLVAVVLRISQISGQSSDVDINPDIQIASSSETAPVQEEVEGEDLIVLDSPSPSQVQSRKISVSGRARGGWFFEGSFPITITDKYGNQLARSHVQAQSDWMTEEMVPFSGEISIPDGMAVPSPVLMRLEADNPSGGEGEVPPALTLPLEIR